MGYALFFHNFSTFLGRAGIYLEDLIVLPQERGHGYGKALLKELARIAMERGCGRLEWSCLDWNQPSIDFYTREDARRPHGRVDGIPPDRGDPGGGGKAGIERKKAPLLKGAGTAVGGDWGIPN